MADANMKAKYESLSASVLKDLARARKIRGISKLKKEELIEVMLKQDEEDARIKEDASKDLEAEKNVEAEKPAKTKKSAETKDIAETPKTVEKEKAEEAEKPVKNGKNQNRRRSEKNRSNNNSEGEKKSRHRNKKNSEKNSDRPDHEDKPKTAEEVHEKEDKTENVVKAEKSEKEYEEEIMHYDDLKEVNGILEVLPECYGFIRSDNYMPGLSDVYVSPSQIRKFNLKTGDMIKGKTRKNKPGDKYGALLLIETINDLSPEEAGKRKNFEDLTPVFPNERIRLENPQSSVATRIVDLFSPIGKGQRGMIVAQPKAGKTTLLKQIASSVKKSHENMHIIVLLIDERPEEVTDMKESIGGGNVEVIYSTFDELPEHHKRVSEMVIERAKRLVEHGEDVMILLDSITRLARAYNLTVPPSGRTLSGGLDPAALHMPKRFFGAARNLREGGSLTILATALVETGSKMDDVVYEEFKGTGNMELILDRKLSERRVFPAIDLVRSGTRREDLLLDQEEQVAMNYLHKFLNDMRKEDATESVLNLMTHTKTNREFVQHIIQDYVLKKRF